MSKQILSRNNNPLIFNTFPLVYEIPVPPLLGFLNFMTNASTDVFGLEFGVSGGPFAILNWDLGDASNNVDANSFSHTYAAGNKYVKVYAGATSGPSSITSVDMYPHGIGSGNLVGVLDISCLTELEYLQVHDNYDLTQIINPVSSQIFTEYNAYDCNLTGTLDVSGLIGLGGDFDVYDNLNLTQILNPDSSQAFNTYYANHCDLTGTLNMSGLTGLGGDFDVNSNPNLTQILNPVSSQLFNAYYANDCNLIGTLDISGLTGLGGEFSVNNNPSLNQILNPVSSHIFSAYRAMNCNLTGILDISSLTGLGGYFEIGNNSNLTNVLNPNSSELFLNYNIEYCNITGILDISKLTGFGGQLEAYHNPNLTQILNPTSAHIITYYTVYNCNLTGILDVSGLTGLGGNFDVHDNINLTNLILTSTLTQQFRYFNVKNCSLNTSSIDAALAKLHALYDASAPVDFLIGNFDGGGNAWPTDGSSNVDYLGIYSAFAAAGKVADISINYPPTLILTYMTFSTEASTNEFDPVFSTEN